MEHATLGRRIRDLRLAKGLTASALAHHAGVTENAIRKIESGDSREPRFSTGVRIARALGVDPGSMIGEPDSGRSGPELAVVIRRIRGLREDLQKVGVAHVAVFGSVARGDSDSKSDIDVIIQHTPHRTFSLIALAEIANILQRACGRPVDVLTRGTLERTAFSAAALKEAVSVF